MRALILWSMLIAHAHAQPRSVQPVLTDLAMPEADDARKAIAIGPTGQVYEPNGKGAWVRDRAVTMANDVTVVGRANGGAPWKLIARAPRTVDRLIDDR